MSLVASMMLVNPQTVYYGTVYPLGSADPVYVYERRVDGDVSTHTTRDLDGRTVLVESAVHDADYHLASYTLEQDPLGRTGTITVDDDTLTFRTGGRERTEVVRAPVVVGPTLVGHLVRNLDRLRAGERLDVRFAVLERLGTVGFGVRALPDGRIRMTASNWLFRLAVRPIDFTFDDAGLLVRLEGRVPAKIRVGDRWKDLDARVEYQFVADTYR